MLAVVTATAQQARAAECLTSWHTTATSNIPVIVVVNGVDDKPFLGPVRAFRKGVEACLARYPDVDLIACLHDDLLIHEPDWDLKIERSFARHPEVGLAGFGGAIGLGADSLYQAPYDPMQLARIGYRSNTSDAEAHGIRRTEPEPVVCLDGFSQIGRRAFWEGAAGPWHSASNGAEVDELPPWRYLDAHGFVHHFYDGALGCLARRLGWRVHYIPLACQHLGGQTAVGDPGYHAWAASQIEGGDRGFWEAAHRLGYDLFKDVLPLRLADRR